MFIVFNIKVLYQWKLIVFLYSLLIVVLEKRA